MVLFFKLKDRQETQKDKKSLNAGMLMNADDCDEL